MVRTLWPLTLLVLLTAGGCTEERPSNGLGDAYVAPQTLNIRSQISQKSGAVTSVKHSEKVSILDVQHRMVKVSTAAGFEGWVEASDLLSPAQMQQIQKERAVQKALPSQGAATAFELLNVHIEPTRRSPAFAQIPEGGPVVVLGRTQAVKNAVPTKTASLVVERPQPPKRPKKEQKALSGFRPPSKPPPPPPPANWQELSAERIDGEADPPTPEELEAEKKKNLEAEKEAQRIKLAKHPIVMEDWTLIRTKAGETGWVLTRNLNISIPDDVAQYAEGKRITSFFDLGTVTDEEKGVKHNWLWTTLSGKDAVDFDSWRVFLWSLHRHRYETSYRQRDLDGYFPVEVDAPSTEAKNPGRSFHIVTKDDDGNLRRRTYLFDGTLVHLTGTEEVRQPDPGMLTTAVKPGAIDAARLDTAARPNWFKRQWNLLYSRLSSR